MRARKGRMSIRAKEERRWVGIQFTHHVVRRHSPYPTIQKRTAVEEDEGSMALSSTMLSAVSEVDLGMEYVV
jgi:hypothetical protein